MLLGAREQRLVYLLLESQ